MFGGYQVDFGQNLIKYTYTHIPFNCIQKLLVEEQI